MMLFRALLLIILASTASFGQFKNAYFSSVKIINSDSTHGDLDNTEYVNSDGKYRYKENGVWYYRANTAMLAGATVYNGQSPTTVTVGGLTSGTDISGQTISDIIESIVAPYVSPVFNSFTVSGQSTVVPVGTTLSGDKMMLWNISQNSGTVPTVDIYDITAGTTLVSGTPNDGSQVVTITTKQLTSNGATQQWRAIGNNTSPAGTFNSSTFGVTARFPAYYGAAEEIPDNSAEVIALPSDSYVSGTHNVDFETGTTYKFFNVVVPPGWQVTSMIDLDAFNAPMPYTLIGPVDVEDVSSTEHEYDVYAFSVDITYPESHTIRATIAPE